LGVPLALQAIRIEHHGRRPTLPLRNLKAAQGGGMREQQDRSGSGVHQSARVQKLAPEIKVTTPT